MTSANHVEVSLDEGLREVNGDFPAYLSQIDSTRIKILVELILAGEEISWTSIGIILSGHEHTRTLNRTYLNHDFDTDVLSFLVDKSELGIEGEVYVDVETALERHLEFDSTLRDEIERYVAHGTLHLAGHLDETPELKAQMHLLEDTYLSELARVNGLS